MTFGEKLKQMLKDADKRPADFCRETGITAPGMSYYIRDMRIPNTYNLIRIANGFCVSVDTLLEGVTIE